MVAILNSLQKWLLEKRIVSHINQIGFLKEFGPIYLSKEETKKEEQLHFLNLKWKEKRLPFEIQARIESPYFLEDLAYQENRIKNKYHWKKRAIIQKSKRLEQKTKTKDLSLDGTLKNNETLELNALQDLKNRFYLENVTLSSKDFKQATQPINTLFEMKIDKVNTSFEKRTKDKLSKIDKKIKLHEDKVSELKPKLQLLQKELSEHQEQLEPGTILKLDNLSMHFGGLKAVDNLSFDVKEGSIFGLIGPNGAGKTTVFNCITRFYKASGGKVYYRNHTDEVILLNDFKVHNVIKEGIVRTFQNVELIWELNVIDNLLVAAHTIYRSSFFGHLFNSKMLRHEELILRGKAQRILQDLELQNYMFMYPLGLPYGILKKVELARTLMANPRLIILDEPAAGLNDTETENLAKTIKKIRDDYHATIFLVEHDMGLVMDVCDTICAISFGKKLALGSPKEIQNSKVVREAYLGGE